MKDERIYDKHGIIDIKHDDKGCLISVHMIPKENKKITSEAKKLNLTSEGYLKLILLATMSRKKIMCLVKSHRFQKDLSNNTKGCLFISLTPKGVKIFTEKTKNKLMNLEGYPIINKNDTRGFCASFPPHELKKFTAEAKSLNLNRLGYFKLLIFGGIRRKIIREILNEQKLKKH
jgi:hypothetical protein